MDRRERGRRLAEALATAAASSVRDVVVSGPVHELPDGRGRFAYEIDVEADRLPDDFLSAWLQHRHKQPPAREPHRLIDPSDVASTDALAEEVEHMLHLRPDDDITIQSRDGGSSPDRPTDERWVVQPTAGDLRERILAVRTGRGGEVAIAIVEQPRAVARLAVGRGLRGPRVTGRLEDRLAPERRRRPFGRWRLRGRAGETEPILRTAYAALVAFEPTPLQGRTATLALRLERNATAVRTARSFGKPLAIAWLAALAVTGVLWIAGYHGQGILADPTLDPAAVGIFTWVLTALGTLPAYVAFKVTMLVLDRLDVRWTVEGWIGRGVGLTVYAAWVVSLLVVPLPWTTLAALLVLVTVGGLLLLALLTWVVDVVPGQAGAGTRHRRLLVPWLAVLAGMLLAVATIAGALVGGSDETAYLLLVSLAAGGVATGLAARRVAPRAAVASVGIGVGVVAIVLGAVALVTSGLDGLLAILIGLPAITWASAAGAWWAAGRIGALRAGPTAEH